MRRINYDSSSNSKHFCFYWTKKHFISEWYFANYKTMRLGVLWWEKLKNRESQGRIVPWAWTSLGVEEQLLIFSLCLSPGWVKNLQMFINVCLKVDHSANLNHSKSTWRQPNQEKQPWSPSHFALEKQLTSCQWIRACALCHTLRELKVRLYSSVKVAVFALERHKGETPINQANFTGDFVTVSKHLTLVFGTKNKIMWRQISSFCWYYSSSCVLIL